MNRQYVKWYSPNLHQEMELLQFGHYGMPILAFPSSMGTFHEWEDMSMVKTAMPHIEAGRVKLYLASTLDKQNWYLNGSSHSYRATHYSQYEKHVLTELVPHITSDSGGMLPTLAGVSFGAYHALNLFLRRPLSYHGALGMSGMYDLRFLLGDYHDTHVYFHNPIDFCSNLWREEDLKPLQYRNRITLYVGQGAFEGPSLESTRQLSGILASKGIPHNLEIWGHDVAHEWNWWHLQLNHAIESGKLW